MDYDQAVPLLIEAVDYLSTQTSADAFVNESGDQMQGNLRMGFGSDVLWYSDNDVTLTASVDALTGNASFAGDVSVTDILGTVTLGDGLVQVTTTDNNIVIGSGAIAITDLDGTLSLRDGSIIMDGNIAMAPLKTVDGVDVSELKNTVDSHGITINVHGATINDLKANKVFAYGRATLTNSGFSTTICNGYNISGGHGFSASDVRCDILDDAPNTNYSVVVTATSGGGCIYGGIIPQVTSKTTSDFHINTYCNVTGPTSAVTNVDFVVFEQ